MIVNFQLLKDTNNSYDKRKITQHILICKNCKNKRLIEKSKVELFISMSKIIVKNVNNFIYLTKDYNKEPLFSEDDLVNECFITLEKCIKSFDINMDKEFFWFYNKATSRMLLRIIERNYKKRGAIVDIEDFSAYNNEFVNKNNYDFLQFYLESIKFTNLEKKVIESKLEMVRLKDFLKKNKNINNNKYYSILNSIKEKIRRFYYE